ncbi:hypothetical protein MOQ_001241 [Trypanosoma cruzi marinkellei]|uniref:Uncharacterized protein n=1 Tax=Trypanosoma cruzi marinkellei TaxID=85056 RepID=K2NUA5_TRYCR|nr:hypothetical protein MOQ_001241 [Trypanosoma cruzi marinkellei]
MNFEDPFADDLQSLDTVMAQFAAGQSRQSRPPPPGSGTSNVSTAIAGKSATGLEGRMGRRDAGSIKNPGQQVKPVAAFATVTRTPASTFVGKDEPVPWEMYEKTSTTARTNASATTSWGTSLVAHVGERDRHDAAAVGRGDGNDVSDKEDPLAFLERAPSLAAPVVEQSHAIKPVGAAAALSPQKHIEDEEARGRAERRDLLSSLDAVGMELDQIHSTLDRLQIQADTELTELETKIIEKQTELTIGEDRIASERRQYDSYHQQRLKDITDRTTELLQRQVEEVTSMEKERYEAQVRALTAETVDAKNRIDQLFQQRELLLQQHRYDEKGIFLALADEEEANEKKKAADGGVGMDAEGGPISITSSVETKMNAALRLLWRHHNERMESLATGVVRFLHQETMEVAREVRERHELAYLQDAVTRKEDLGEFMQDFLRRYREFFQHRAELRSRNMAALRRGLQEATEQLRLRARQRLEKRTQEVAAQMDEAARRFEKLALESAACVRRKAAAVRESDESVAKSQRADLESRCQMERAVAEQLQQSEVETLQQQLERMRRLGNDSTNEDDNGVLRKKVAGDMCTARAESIAGKVRELENSVQQLLRQQLLRNQAHGDKGEGQSFLTDEELFSRMAVQEKEAVVLSLFEEVQKRQNELSATRQRCGELRESIAFKMQEEVQTVRQQRLAQESHLASVELLRMAWEREQRELLQWGSDMMVTHGDSASTIASTARTQLPAATTTMDLMSLIAGRNHAIMEERLKLRTRRRQLLHTMEKERENVVAKQRETEGLWAQFCEQLVGLMAEEHAVSAQRFAAATEIAKMAAMRELISHDKELFCRRREEMQEEVERLKRELQATLTQQAEYDALQQKIALEQTALAQQQRQLAIEHSRLGRPVASAAEEEEEETRYPPAKQPPRLDRPLSPGEASLRRPVKTLQEVTGRDNIPAPREKPRGQQQGRETRRNTLPPSMARQKTGRSFSHTSLFTEGI